MSDLIKIPDVIRRQDAVDAIMDLPNCPNGCSDTYDKACIIGALEDVPSMQDEIAKAVAAVIEQPSIIRCKDCTYRNGDYCHRFHDGYSAFIHLDDFCNYAERGTDE